jgi:uncharacterized coiled-coil protein SlyX
MKLHTLEPTERRLGAIRYGRQLLVVLCLLVALCDLPGHALMGQEPTQDTLTQRIVALNEAMARSQAQLQQAQRDLEEMRHQLDALQQQMAEAMAASTSASPSAAQPAATATATASGADSASGADAASGTDAMDELRERQAMQETQIATLQQAKVESASKYSVKLSGLVLLNGFVNTQRVDMAATPTVALPGSGSTGASVRQTVLGLDAWGPHLFGARSQADLRVDFYGAAIPSALTASSPGATYNQATALLRLRTAHAALEWPRTQAFFSLDRPIFNPNAPDSLTAVAEPALAWSGNLWAWNPQVGATHDLALRGSNRLRMQAALTDVQDAPVSSFNYSNAFQASEAEQSRWPGVEARLALVGTRLDDGAHVGVGGYFAPHRTANGYHFDSWAASLDYRVPLPGRLALTGSVYRGLALGGLGAGAFKDYTTRVDADTGAIYSRALEDVGGWAQLKEKASERLEFNAAFGVDEVFAGQLRPYAGTSSYQNLARNRSYTGNVIYSPSSYLLFSVEYRRLQSSPVVGATAESNIIGLGAGYKF